MNTLYKAITISLAMIASTAFGRHAECFQPYTVTIHNKSGDRAELIRSTGIGNFRINERIKNYGTKTITVNELGAHLTISYGPEDKERTDRINFYAKTDTDPGITLNPSSLQIRGFSQQHAQPYTVAIENKTGGKAIVTETCNVALKGSIDNNATKDARVQVGSTVTFVMGPKDNKQAYKIRFSTPAEGGNPHLTLQQPGWFLGSAVVGENVRFGASRMARQNKQIQLGPKETGKKIRSGACGKNKMVTRIDEN